MICFIDFETTGVNVFRDEPIEFGAILCNNNLEVINRFESRIQLGSKAYLKKSAFNIHKIKSEDLENSPDAKKVLSDFFVLFGTNYRFAGWNINFDVSFFRKLCNRNGMMVTFNKINHRHIDVQSISHLATQVGILPDKLNSLSDVTNYLGLIRHDRHSAIEDAFLTMEVYKTLVTSFKTNLTFRFPVNQ